MTMRAGVVGSAKPPGSGGAAAASLCMAIT